MEQNEMMIAFNELYSKMSQSKDIKAMRIFGDTMRVMMEDLVINKPELAEEYIEQLSAIQWDNYLTKKEAITIVENMIPTAHWEFSTWEQAMMDISCEERPYYNQYALFAVMNQVISDHGQTIACIKGAESINDIEISDLVKYAYRMAIDLLKDKDGKYNVRRYFIKEQ